MKPINHNLKPALVIVAIIVIALLVTFVLPSCNVVQRTKGTVKTDSAHIVLTDTIRVKKIDTTKIHSEVNEYHVKTVELYDTTWKTKDSLVTYLKKRIVYSDSFINRTIINNGSTLDSGSGKKSDSSHLIKEVKKVQVEKKKVPWYLYFLAIAAIVFMWITHNIKSNSSTKDDGDN